MMIDLLLSHVSLLCDANFLLVRKVRDMCSQHRQASFTPLIYATGIDLDVVGMPLCR